MSETYEQLKQRCGRLESRIGRLLSINDQLLEACRRGHQRLLKLGQKESYRTVSIMQTAIEAAES